MKTTTKSRIQMLGAWCGVGYIVTILVGWALIAGFLPPTSPQTGADEIAANFTANVTSIRIGMVVVMFSALIFIPFAATLTQALTKIEGGAGVLTYSCLLGSAGNMVLTFYPAIWWLVAAFRPERSADLIYLMNDMAWLQFIGGLTMYLGMPISVAIAAFCDTSPDPVFPRWAGFLSSWLAVLMLPDQLLFFFHAGPFAWNGIFGLWIPVGAFCVWFFLTFHLLRKAILRERQGSA